MKKTKTTFLAAALAALAALGGEAVQLDGVAAEVGGVQITIADVMADVRETAYAEGRADVVADPAALRGLYSEALSNLVSRRLVLLQYERGGAKIPDWYFNQRIERIVETSFGGDKAKLVAALESRGLSFPEWRRRRVEDMIFGTMRRQFVEQNVKVRPAAVEALYREKYAGAALPGRVKVSMILLACEGAAGETLETARELVRRLRGGEDFAALARKFSVDTHAADGGCWGYVEPEDAFRKELVDALAPLAAGGVSEPVKAGDYVYILRKDDERADLSVPLELVRGEIEEAILRAEGDRRFAEWLAFLARQSTVRVFPAP